MKLIAIPLLLIIVGFKANAQGHIPQTPAVSFSFGKSYFTTIFGAGYTYFINEKTFLSGQLNYEYGEAHQFKFQSISTDFLTNHSFLNLNGNFYLNAGAGLSLAYESLQPDATKGFNYGGLIRGEVETFITDAISVSLWGDQAFLAKKDIGNLRARYGLGIRLFF